MTRPQLAGTVEDRPAAAAVEALQRRALSVWPRLDPSALRRCGEDVRCVAALVERRTSLPPESIISILTVPAVTEDESRTWFG